MILETLNLEDKFQNITEHWSPKIVAQLNGQHVKVAKIKGEFVMHHHLDEDELFWVYKGQFIMRFNEPKREVLVRENEMIVIPKGVDHQPIAEDEAWIVLFEPITTLNTGNQSHSTFTKQDLDRI